MLTSGSICEHIKIFYPRTVGDPIFYWEIDENWFGQIDGFVEARIEDTLSDSGDECHKDIINTLQSVPLKLGQEKRNQYNLFSDNFCKPPNLYVCLEDSSCQQITTAEYKELENHFNI